MSQFFETLRLELGSDVPITVFLPGVIKSEMTDGKGVQPDGRLPHSYEEAVDRRNVSSLVVAFSTTGRWGWVGFLGPFGPPCRLLCLALL